MGVPRQAIRCMVRRLQPDRKDHPLAARPSPRPLLACLLCTTSLLATSPLAASLLATTARAQAPGQAEGQSGTRSGAETGSQPQPQPLPMPPPIAAPTDTTWPGTIDLAVDATDLERHVVSVDETIPVSRPGPMVLLYPHWVPGDHGPTGPLPDLAGLAIEAGGHGLPWRRDAVDMYAFHLDVPKGASALSVRFQYLSPVSDEVGRIEMTPEMLDLAWNTVVLYPAGHFSRDIEVAPSLRLPQGWQFATALRPATPASDGRVSFKPVGLNTLVDSPLYAGLYSRTVDLAPGAAVPVLLHVFADRPGDLAMSPSQIAKHRALVQQATRLFGAQHYNHYDFLLALSDQLGGIGLEHHRSSENGVGRGYFTQWDKDVFDRDLLPHEYTHSWNGKFRRPADLWAPNFNVPERDSLLWVYEGQTQFWGQVLAARSGLWSHQDALDAIAEDAADMQTEVGRAWRPLQDTTEDPIINLRHPQSWHSWEREEDYYTEGLLIWLDADQIIRARSNGKRSIDDFAHEFFSMDDGDWGVLPYRFDDIVTALNRVVPYDWAGFLHDHLDRTGGSAPLDGITRGGWRLVYTDKPSDYTTSFEGVLKRHDFSASLGLVLGEDSAIDGVVWNSPAWKAGLVRGAKILAVDGLAFDGPDDLASAIRAAHGSQQPVELLVQDGKHFRDVRIAYHDGLRYPHLQRIPGKPDTLSALLAPRAG